MIPLISIGISIGYVGLILFLFIGWVRQKKRNGAITIKHPVFVSVIIPARNEEANILHTLQSIEKQTYQKVNFEVIIVDDASDDLTKQICEDFFTQHPNLNGKVITIENIAENTAPKKRALNHGIAIAKGEVIITTDADCKAYPQWIEAHVERYEKDHVAFVSGAVIYQPLKTPFDYIQALEFTSLVVSGAGAIGNRLPLMSNGANLSFLKSAFETVGGYSGNTQYASGDDVFLMYKIKQQLGKDKVAFLKHPNALTATTPKERLGDFLQQRIRWASKSKAYRSFFSIFSSVIVLLMNVLLFLLSISCFFYPSLLHLTLMAWSMKMVIDFIIIQSFTTFTRQQNILWYFLPSQLFVMVYTVIVGFLGISGKFEWKGRQYKN